MKAINNTYKLAISAAIVAAIVGICWLAKSYHDAPEADTTKIYAAMIEDIKPMFKLCTVEIREDYPMDERIGNKHIFAKVALRGSISFDIDNLKTENRGDTLVVYMPDEIVDVKESTDPNSYQVIDTWNDNLLGSNTLTTAEENRVKERVAQRFRKYIYSKGYVDRARQEARTNLTAMAQAAFKCPVVVVDE
jgi:hypothetical protein